MFSFFSNPKTRKLVLFGGLGGAVVVALAIFFVSQFLSSNSPSDILEETKIGGSGLSENLVEKIGRNITEMQEELQNDFYKGLKKHSWIPDAAKAGRENPFLK